MSDPSASTDIVSADSESTPSLGSSRSDGSRDNGARAMALVVGVVIGMGIGLGIGMGIGSAARKRIDRWSIHY
jgi:hypothetical protein